MEEKEKKRRERARCGIQGGKTRPKPRLGDDAIMRRNNTSGDLSLYVNNKIKNT